MRQTTRLSLLALAGIALMPANAFAQNADVQARVDRLENDIQTLSRAVFKGEKMPTPLSPMLNDTANPANADLLVRLQQMESDLRDLTGRVEQQTYDISQLKEQMERVGYQMDAMKSAGREPTPVMPQSPEYLRPNDMDDPLIDQAAAAVQPLPQSYDEQAATDGIDNPPPQPAQMGMKTATPVMPDGSDPNALYENAYTKIKAGDFASAETAFGDFIARYPDHKLTGNAYYWLGESYYVRGQYEEAARTFAQSYQKFPNGVKGPDNLLKLGLSLAGAGKKEDACVALGQLTRQYPAAAPEIKARSDEERRQLGCTS